MLRLLVIPAALLAMLAGAVVWSSKGEGPPADFVFTQRGDNKTLDTGVMSWMQDMRIAYALWEGLYTPDPVTLLPVPGSADKIDVSPDKAVWTFHIRDSARWSNGEPLTAGDFRFAWRRMLEQPAEYTYLLEYIKGAHDYEDAFSKWKARIGQGKQLPRPDFKMVGVEVLGPRVLKVTLDHPLPFFTSLCAFPTFFPQYEPCMKPFAQMDPTGTYVASYDEKFTRPPNLVTNGPYRLADWTFKRRLRMIASDYYWDRAHVKSRIVDQMAVDDSMAGFRAYQSGKLDWISEVDLDLAGDLLEAHRSDLKIFPSFGTYFYDFNCQPKLSDGSKNPFADARVRRAFSMAVDKRPIVENVTRTGERVATTLVPVGSFADYPSPPGLPYNPEEARRQLAQAGYPGGAGFPHMHILFNNDFTEHQNIAQVVRRQWQVNLGVDVDLEGVEIKVFGQRAHNHEFNVARASWFGDYYDPSTFTDVYKSSSSNNDPDWRNKQYDDLLHKAEFETDPNQRMKILAQAENLLLNEAPILPLFQYVGQYLLHDNVHGIPLDPRHLNMMQAVWVDRGK